MYLLQFLKAYLEWVEGGAKDHNWFDRDKGLCGAAIECETELVEAYGLTLAMRRALENDFAAGVPHGDPSRILLWSYPFNNYKMLDYKDECRAEATHKNQKRIDWARNKVKELEDAQQ